MLFRTLESQGAIGEKAALMSRADSDFYRCLQASRRRYGSAQPGGRVLPGVWWKWMPNRSRGVVSRGWVSNLGGRSVAGAG